MRLGKYDVLGPIGIGGFGKVLLARAADQVHSSTPLVAIKRLRRARAQKKRPTDDPLKFEEAFRYEAEICSHLTHPNIVRIFEMAKVGKDYLLVMEFINGLGLDELLGQRRQKGLALPPDIALQIAIQAGTGLHYAHEACSADGQPLHIVHRDVKPSNIMICKQGIVRVMDFGVARSVLHRSQTTTGTIKGTLRYLSPEQAQGARDVGPASDQFALGLVLGEMLIGRPVYEADHDHQVLMKALRGQVDPAIAAAERVCPGIGPVLGRVLGIGPEDRYPTVGAFMSALKEIVPPTESGHTLVEWVHLGLEERARQAIEDPDAFQPLDLSDASGQNLGDLDDTANTGSSVNPFPLGWAHDHLAIIDESDELPGTGEHGWDLIPGQDLAASPIVAHTPPNREGWAMMDATSDEHHWDLLKRGPPTDEWTVPDASTAITRRNRKRTDLVRVRDNSDVQPPAGYSPTAYVVKRPGRDRVEFRFRGSNARIMPRSLMRDTTHGGSETDRPAVVIRGNGAGVPVRSMARPNPPPVGAIDPEPSPLLAATSIRVGTHLSDTTAPDAIPFATEALSLVDTQADERKLKQDVAAQGDATKGIRGLFQRLVKSRVRG